MKRNLTYIPNVNVKAEEQVESLRRLVAKKKANDEKIPWELLQTHYKNPYEKLLKEIKDCAGKVLYWNTVGSLRFNRDADGQACYRQLMVFLNERNSGEFGRRSWQLLMSEYNIDGYMFINCEELAELICPFDTSKVTDMYGMFSMLPKLTSLDLSTFNTSKVKDMGDMFEDSYNLTRLKLGAKFVFVGSNYHLPRGTWYASDGTAYTSNGYSCTIPNNKADTYIRK